MFSHKCIFLGNLPHCSTNFDYTIFHKISFVRSNTSEIMSAWGTSHASLENVLFGGDTLSSALKGFLLNKPKSTSQTRWRMWEFFLLLHLVMMPLQAMKMCKIIVDFYCNIFHSETVLIAIQIKVSLSMHHSEWLSEDVKLFKGCSLNNSCVSLDNYILVFVF